MAKGTKFEIRNWKRDRWERIRRNPAYIAAYNKFRALEKTKVEGARKQSKQRRDLAAMFIEICEEYDVSDVIDPSKSFKKSMSPKIGLTDSYIAFPIRDGRFTMPMPIRGSSFNCIDGRSSKGEPLYRKCKPEEALVDSRYLAVLLDVNMPDKFVQETAVKAAKVARDALNLSDQVFRMRIEENQIAYSVWDMRAVKMPFTDIAVKLFPSVSVKRGAARARKSFIRAYELITGKPYRAFTKREIKKLELKKTCATCKDKSCLRGMRSSSNPMPCPEILAYIDQDQVGGQEYQPYSVETYDAMVEKQSMSEWLYSK